MRAGALRHKVRIDSRTVTQDAAGGSTVTWTEFDTMRASIEPFEGREFFEAHAINELYTVRIRMRYKAGMDTDKRIVDTATGDVYDVQSIINVGRRNREMEIIATNLNEEAE